MYSRYGFSRGLNICLIYTTAELRDSRLANFGKETVLFGFLLVGFWLWCSCFKRVLLSLWCLGRKVLVVVLIPDHCPLFYFYYRISDNGYFLTLQLITLSKLSAQATLSKLFCLPSEKVYILKGNNLIPFLSFQSRTLSRKGISVLEIKYRQPSLYRHSIQRQNSL